MSAVNLMNVRLKLKQIQRNSKQNVTITNLYANKSVQPKPMFRFIPSIKVPVSNSNSEPSSVIEPTILNSEPSSVIEPTILNSEPTILNSEPTNTNFTLQYIKSKIMNDYGNLYKSA